MMYIINNYKKDKELGLDLLIIELIEFIMIIVIVLFTY